ncbi:MAG: ornithine cyclodeaminase family protein [Patescibacteria group bacterium]
MLLLNQKEVEKIIPLRKISKVIEAALDGFFEYGIKRVQMPPKPYLYFKEFNGDLRIMPAYSEKLKMAATKIVNVHPDNPKIGLKTVMAAIILNDAKTGLPVAFMDGTYITGMRTGAASAVATNCLARKDAKILGVIGAGYQSIFQIAAITKVRKIEKILVYDIFDEKIKKLVATLAKEKIKIVKATLEEVAKSDILATVTPAKGPILKRQWVLPGTHINAIGADAQGKEELDPQILIDGKIVIDNWEQASHSGEINVPLSKGIIKRNDIYAELSEIASGKKKGRNNDREITIFDSTGLAIQDLFVANYVFKNAGKIGKKFDLI